jgi:putative membrane protein
VLALLLTTMHMTLLGVLIALAPRPLFGTVHAASPGTLDPAPFGMPLSPLEDQQLGGVIMLVVGAGSYLLGALVLLGGLLRASGTEAPQRCS